MKYSTTVVALLSLVLIISKAEVFNLTEDNFHEIFNCKHTQYPSRASPKQDWFLMFMAPWCGHCQKAKPQFQNFQALLANKILKQHQQNPEIEIQQLFESYTGVAAVNCVDNRGLCGHFNVRGFPTFIYLTKDGQAIKYTGPRITESFYNFTLYHEPGKHSYCDSVKIGHSVFDQLLELGKIYWPQVLVLGVILPSLLGYCLGILIYGRKKPEKPEKAEKEQKKLEQSKEEQKKVEQSKEEKREKND